MRDMIQKATQALINNGLADLPVSITIKSSTLSTYDPVTGTTTRTVVELTTKAVLTDINQKDTNDVELLTNGKKALVAGADLNGMDVDALDDTVTIDGVSYQLKSYKVDPAGALYSLMLLQRTPG